MSKLYNSLEQSLIEAIAIEKGELPLVKRENFETDSYYVPNNEEKLIDRLTEIRKEEKISQTKLAEMIGVKQQAISRTEKKENCPSLKLFCEMVYALGYDIRLVKK